MLLSNIITVEEPVVKSSEHAVEAYVHFKKT